MTQPESQPDQAEQLIVVGPDGQPIGAESDEPEERDIAAQIEQPAKVMRIGRMVHQLLEEVRAAPLDEAGRARLREIHEASVHELEEALAPELATELRRFSLPFADNDQITDAELRIAQAQLVGWLEGLFHGIQTALFAQQMAARAQLEQMRRPALPSPGPHGLQPQPMQPTSGTGQYL